MTANRVARIPGNQVLYTVVAFSPSTRPHGTTYVVASRSLGRPAHSLASPGLACGRGHGRGHGHGRSPTSITGTAPTRVIQSHYQAVSSTTFEEYGTPTIPLPLSHSAAPTLSKQRRNRQFRKITKSVARLVQNVRDYFESEKARGQRSDIGKVVKRPKTQPESGVSMQKIVAIGKCKDLDVTFEDDEEEN
jgi:hypothetical protein